MGVLKVSVLLILYLMKYASTAPKKVSPELYLSKYGYLPPAKGAVSKLLDEKAYKKAIKEFQRFAGIKVTGKLDAKTLEIMSLPRCGVKDIVERRHTRAKKYALAGSKWPNKDLTYRISKYPRRLQRSIVDKEIQRAFDVWSEYTDLTFKPKSGAVDIDITFVTGRHGDSDPFDGLGGTLAHAYFPTHGDTHFDDSETWTINSYSGTNLFQVAAHEFGHAVGLDHTNVDQALMFPLYTGYNPLFSLHNDDIQGIQALYGKKTHGLRPPYDDDDYDDFSGSGSGYEDYVSRYF